MNKDFLFGTVFGAIVTWVIVFSLIIGTVFGIVLFLNQDATARYSVRAYNQ